ncbi:outer membrane protein [Chelatococcus composti]|jgi:Opacity protein and related surface antigens|uniref:Outer membrane immunogenic protein n=1 Tax=Chelatococcus composti TaxID=1743235 RepID=A0A841KFI5_9HYPH|nr:outer membrane protein [Chelatococcus composti]MBB6168009.1 outer membrane immunogenic protein [Chelatococcus composti]MBS7734799.1 porin family protein [Chelatococcus composti]
MKKILLAGVAAAGLIASGAAAFAADLPSRNVAPVAPAPVLPIFTWTGFYAGVNAGYGWGEFSKAPGFDDPDGFVGGAQIGYNYQIGQFVVGLETDIQYSDLSGKTRPVTFADGNVGVGRGEVEYFGTVRGRIGAAFDRALIYVTGGLAYGETKFRGLDTTAGLSFSKSKTTAGWTIGGGLEYAFTDNITAKAEYLYVDLGDNRYYGANKAETKFSVVRAGLNYKF